MSKPSVPELTWVTAEGSPHQIGRILGEVGRSAVHEVLRGDDSWQAATDSRHARVLQTLAENVQSQFPQIWEELVGLSEGLKLPLEQVVAWNCRGDLMSNVPDGCTTVQIPGVMPVIAHNEDGLPGFCGHAFIAEIKPDNGPRLISYCYPGSISGHTFSLNGSGLIQTVNNIRLRDVSADIPRMVLCRAVLSCEKLDNALDLLHKHNNCGGFHMTLAQTGDPRLVSVEFGGGGCEQRIIDTPSIHTNHALNLADGDVKQIITASSIDRQKRGMQLILDGVSDPLAILRDQGGIELPIHRTDMDDPDNENTIASAVFHVGNTAVKWEIYDQNSERPVFTGENLDR